MNAGQKKSGDFTEESPCGPQTFWHAYQIDDSDFSEGRYNFNP